MVAVVWVVVSILAASVLGRVLSQLGASADVAAARLPRAGEH